MRFFEALKTLFLMLQQVVTKGIVIPMMAVLILLVIAMTIARMTKMKTISLPQKMTVALIHAMISTKKV
jgi:hypothetical protein